MAHDPLSPSEALRTPVGLAIAVVSVLVLAYSLVIVAQILLGVMVAGGLTVGLYLSYRLLAALDSIADGAQRLADAREREAEAAARAGGAPQRDSATTEHDSSTSRSSDRITERER